MVGREAAQVSCMSGFEEETISDMFYWNKIIVFPSYHSKTNYGFKAFLQYSNRNMLAVLLLMVQKSCTTWNV